MTSNETWRLWRAAVDAETARLKRAETEAHDADVTLHLARQTVRSAKAQLIYLYTRAPEHEAMHEEPSK